jgi:hypothetical protein
MKSSRFAVGLVGLAMIVCEACRTKPVANAPPSGISTSPATSSTSSTLQAGAVVPASYQSPSSVNPPISTMATQNPPQAVAKKSSGEDRDNSSGWHEPERHGFSD